MKNNNFGISIFKKIKLDIDFNKILSFVTIGRFGSKVI